MTELVFEQKVRGQLGFIPVDFEPTGLSYAVMAKRWWVFHPEQGMAWHRRTAKARYWTPQCNADKRVAEHLRDKLYPGLEVRYVEHAFVQEWDEEHGTQPYTNALRLAAFVAEGPARPAMIGPLNPFREGT